MRCLNQFFVFALVVFAGCAKDTPVEVVSRNTSPHSIDAVSPVDKEMSAAISGIGTAVIDGILNFSEWHGAGSVPVELNIPEGGTTPGRAFVMNDADNIYLALRFERSFVDPDNSLTFEFDNDNDGVQEQGEDVLLMNPDPGTGFLDEVGTTAPPCPPGQYSVFSIQTTY